MRRCDAVICADRKLDVAATGTLQPSSKDTSRESSTVEKPLLHPSLNHESHDLCLCLCLSLSLSLSCSDHGHCACQYDSQATAERAEPMFSFVGQSAHKPPLHAECTTPLLC
jgi:hypothetical protein